MPGVAVLLGLEEAHVVSRHQPAFEPCTHTHGAQALALAVDGCRWAAQLGARDLIVWPQFDGYDYHFQASWPPSTRAPPPQRVLCTCASQFSCCCAAQCMSRTSAATALAQ